MNKELLIVEISRDMVFFQFLRAIYLDLLEWCFPSICPICQTVLPDGIENLCLSCESDLRYTYFEKYLESSPLDELFWGRVQMQSTFSLLYFSKESSTQQIVHQIKYSNHQDLALYMGKRMAEKLSEKWKLNKPDFFIPVPLHKKKQHKRGYNQSEIISTGIAAKMKIHSRSDILLRNENTKTQTKKSKLARWDNVQDIFIVSSPEKYKNMHLCLVDDVITTGSTIESCAKALQRHVEGCKVSVVSLAFAK